jgi:benzoyl-CoA reductase/2-hydroxyglutaryl-CoA dehydratase subunit BcrC/BadD/HgdB
MKKVALTTTIPVEILFAAGTNPVDLNNIFITADNPMKLIEKAEMAGYPRTTCGWIKGLYSSMLENDIKEIIAVTQGDCTNTHALMETLEMKGVKVIPFAYPYDRDKEILKYELNKLIKYFKVDWNEVKIWRHKLNSIREKVWEIDRLTWEENKVSSFDNHFYQISCSDFEGDPENFNIKLTDFLNEIKLQKPHSNCVRLGYIGVPPIITDLYDYIEEIGARVVFNEVQRQFTMPYAADNLIDQYILYTYPYHVFSRLKDIKYEIKRRKIHGIIHYTQSFCFRQIEDLIFREKLDVPILTIEGENPGKLDARTKIRLDTFVEMIS